MAFLDLMGAYELMSQDDSVSLAYIHNEISTQIPYSQFTIYVLEWQKWLQSVLKGVKPRGDAIRMAKIAQYKREKACKEKELVNTTILWFSSLGYH